MKTMNSAALQVKNNSKNKYSLLRPNSKKLKKKHWFKFHSSSANICASELLPSYGVCVCGGGDGKSTSAKFLNFL